MKKIKFFLVICAFALLAACGNSKEEEDRQKRIEDSLMEIERNKALENANNLLNQEDTTEIISGDSIK